MQSANPFTLWGRLKRLFGGLRSGHPAARVAIATKILSPATRMLDRLERYQHLPDMDLAQNPAPCVMLASPPRSGSTVMFQVLTRVIPCVYPSNLHALFPKHASGYLLRRDRFGHGLSGFENFYGYTSHLNDVNESNELIAQLFRDDADPRHIRIRFCRWLREMRASNKRPLFFKNVRAYSQILKLHQAVPELVFIRIRRDTEQVVQSVLKAYHELGTFHPIPAGLQGQPIRNPVEFAVRQILEIEWTLDSQFQEIDSANWVEWHYEDFCSDHYRLIEQFATEHLSLDPSVLRWEALDESLKASTQIKVSLREASRIADLLNECENA